MGFEVSVLGLCLLEWTESLTSIVHGEVYLLGIVIGREELSREQYHLWSSIIREAAFESFKSVIFQSLLEIYAISMVAFQLCISAPYQERYRQYLDL